MNYKYIKLKYSFSGLYFPLKYLDETDFKYYCFGKLFKVEYDYHPSGFKEFYVVLPIETSDKELFKWKNILIDKTNESFENDKIKIDKLIKENIQVKEKINEI